MALPTLNRQTVSASDLVLVNDVSVTADDKQSTMTREEFLAQPVSVNPDTTHAVPIASGVVAMTKGSASAFTLAAPTSAQNGTRITFISTTAYQHVITDNATLTAGLLPSKYTFPSKKI